VAPVRLLPVLSPRSGQRHSSPTADPNAQMKTKSINGGSVQRLVRRRVKCTVCNGEGWTWVEFCVSGPCPVCNGTGRVRIVTEIINNRRVSRLATPNRVDSDNSKHQRQTRVMTEMNYDREPDCKMEAPLATATPRIQVTLIAPGFYAQWFETPEGIKRLLEFAGQCIVDAHEVSESETGLADDEPNDKIRHGGENL